MPLAGASGCRVYACDKADPALSRRHAQGDGDDEPELLGVAEDEERTPVQALPPSPSRTAAGRRWRRRPYRRSRTTRWR